MSEINVPIAPVAPTAPIAPVAPAVEKAPVKKYNRPHGEALAAYHARAVVAAPTMTMKDFAVQESSQQNHVKACLFDAQMELGLPLVKFLEESTTVSNGVEKKTRGNKNTIILYRYVGRAKNPYMTSKAIPSHLLVELNLTEEDYLVASIEEGRIILTPVRPQPEQAAA